MYHTAGGHEYGCFRVYNTLHEQVAKLRAIHQLNSLVVLVDIQVITSCLNGLHFHCVGLHHLGQEVHEPTIYV